MTIQTASINPSEDDREMMIEFLQQVLGNTESKVKEIDVLMKKSKQKLSPEETKEMEVEKIHLNRNVKLIEDALSKSERTSGHTLKKAFNKKLLVAIKQVTPEDKCTDFEGILDKNGLYHHAAPRARRNSHANAAAVPVA